MTSITDLFHHSKPLDFHGATDWHTHLLPGVDDGVKTMSEALAVLSRYESLGYTQIWLTPHIMEDVPNTTELLRQRFAELQQAYQGPIELHLAAENMLDNLFAERLEAGDLLPIGPQGNTLLVETSYYTPPINLMDTLKLIKKRGYYPLLAHPERYRYITDFKTYEQMINMGVKFQVNLMSLSGHYGNTARTKAQQLLRRGMVDRLGTDLHRIRHLDIISTATHPHSLHTSLSQLF